MTSLLLLLALPAMAAVAAVTPARASQQELAVIVHRRNPTRALSGSELESLFTLSRKSWPHGGAVVPFNHPAGGDLRDEFDRTVLRMSPTQVAKFWIDQRIRGAATPPRQIPTVALTLAVISRLSGAIGYVPAEQVTAQVKVVARISGGDVHPP